ncbi:MAG: GTP-binding protein [Bacteriovoracia bacterium]
MAFMKWSSAMARLGEQIPITILTGFLGAGKTTLLQRILSEKHGKKIAVVENEFANLDIDANLVKSKTDLLVELFNGCVCCSIQGELVESLLEIAKREDRVDHILIETTGVANPSNLVKSFLTDHLMCALFRLDAVITVVDAKHFPLHVEESQDFRDQIAFADLLILNKTDLVGEAELDQVESAARGINQAAEVVRTNMCSLPLERVFDRSEYQNSTIRPERIAAGRGTDLPSLVSSLSLEISGELDQEKFMKWMESFVAVNHEKMFRTKGILWFAGMTKHVVLQGVHAIFSVSLSEAVLLEKGKGRIVFIGRDLPRDQIMAGIKQALPAFSTAGLDAFVLSPVGQPKSPLFLSKTEFSEDLRIRIV